MMKNTFKKKTLCAALFAGVAAVGVSGSANAVYVSPDGTGQALVYPFFTAQSGKITTLSVTNSGPSAKMVKVRFREAKNSREVLDFNLFLSAEDMWTAAVVASGSGGAKLILNPNNPDTSCTNPAIPSSGVAFKNAAYSGTTSLTGGDDGAGTGLDRTLEGYFEIIALGNLTNATEEGYVTHVGGSENPYAAGVPDDCAAIRSANNSVSLSTPSNDLFGSAAIIDVANGTEVSYDATAFAEMVSAAISNGRALGNESPNFTDADEVSTVFHANGNGGEAVYGRFYNAWSADGGVDAVSSTLMHAAVMNEYVLDSEFAGKTDWVVTFPTKHYYVENNNVGVSGITANGTVFGSVYEPFESTFWNGSCDEVSIDFWDREELHNTNPADFSPVSPTSDSLCWEANVVTFNGGNLLASPNTKSIDVGSRPNGWARLTFSTTTASRIIEDNDNNTTYHGLPVIGFAATNAENGNVGGVMSNYGGNFTHKTTTVIDGCINCW